MAKRPSKPETARDPEPTDRIVVLAGKEAFLREHHTRLLREQLKQIHGEVDLFRYDGTNAPVADVLDEARSFGLMTAYKLVVVDDADQFVKEDARPLVERYAQNPAESATLVLRCNSWNRGKLDALINAVGVIVKCEEVSEPAAVTFLADQAKKVHKKPIDRDAAEALVDRLGVSLGRLDTELGKLVLLAGDSKTITTHHVEALVGRSREEVAWTIQNPVLSGDIERALEHLRATLDNTPKASAVPVSWALMDLARKLHSLSATASTGGNVRDAAKIHRMWGPSGDAMIRLAQTMPPRYAERLLDLAIDADVALKSGRGDPTRVLERTAIALTATIRRAQDHQRRSAR